jgi:sugar transferase (PEP-CTERM/EpsH1 system associated)
VKDKPHVLFITLSLDIGGLEVLLLELLKKLDRSAFDFSVCVMEKEGRLIPEVEAIGIPVYTVEKKEGLDFSLPFKLRHLIQEKKIDIVHTHNSTPWLYAGAALKMTRGRHLVHTKHSNLSMSQHRLLSAERFLAKMTDCIIADAGVVAEFMKEKQAIPAEKIKLVYNGIDTQRFIKPMAGEPDRSIPTIGIVARLVSVKDHRTLMNAFKLVGKRLPDARLLIIGDGPLKEELLTYARQEGLNGKVEFTGARRDIPQLLRQMDVFVLSSLDEGMSITLLEAMASGLPVVATKVGGNPEIIIDGHTGFLVPAKAPEEMADKITLLLTDKKLAAAFGENGRKRVADYFSIETMARDYESVYNAISK